MTVYVDDMQAKFGRMTMCHMMANSRAELLGMAGRLQIAQKRLQNADSPREHFDICLSKRAEAIVLGAQQITMREFVGKVREKEAAIRQEACVERAAVKEFCANLPRDRAEQESFLEIYGEMEA